MTNAVEKLKGLIDEIENGPEQKYDNFGDVPEKEQRTMLAERLASIEDKKELKVGDFVERIITKTQQPRYKFPVEGQLAVITRVFDTTLLDEDGDVVTGQITMTGLFDDIRDFAVDLSFYQKTK